MLGLWKRIVVGRCSSEKGHEGYVVLRGGRGKHYWEFGRGDYLLLRLFI
jgi:hypothetical protein